MDKIKSLSDLKLYTQPSESDSDENKVDKVVVKVAMATCGIASGAQETLDYFRTELERQQIPATVSQTGCMSYCYAEPTVEITLPGEEQVVFGFVNSAKAQEIIDCYIVRHQLVDGIIPASYKSV